MALTVGDIVSAPQLGLELLAEGDLSQPVRWVHATDQPDPAPYLRGREIVLTDGLWLTDGPTPTEYVRRLADVHVAAIGFGLIEDRPPPPSALIRACRRRRVTLFAVPVEVPFLAISELFVDHMISEHEEPLRRTLRRNERLLEAVSGADGAAQVLKALHDELGLDLWLRDSSDHLLAHTGSPPQDAGRGWLRLTVPGPGGGAAAAQLGIRHGERPLTVDEQTAIEQARTVLTIDAAHREALRQTHRRFAAELFELARQGEAQASAIAERLHGFGLEPNSGLIAIMCDRPQADDWLARFEDALRRAGLRAVATVRAGRLVAIAEWDPREPVEPLGAQLADAMGGESAVGIGAAVAHCALLDVSLSDARRACRLARLRQDGRRSATARELASHAGLLAQQDPDVLDHFCSELLDPLVAHDAARGSVLLPTLTAFVASGGSWAATAAELHVHVNTLRYRLDRVATLTGRQLHDPDDRVDFHLALRARGLLGTRRDVPDR